MKQEIIHSYFFVVGIHTISGVSTKEIKISELSVQAEKAITICSNRKARDRDFIITYVQMNPNKLQGEQEVIPDYTTFDENVNRILSELGIPREDFCITRADMCFNSAHEEDYKIFHKLNKLLICCLSNTYSVKNCYETRDLWSLESLNVAVKNDTFEIENYDKEKESNGTSQYCNRLEERSKKLNNKLMQYEFVEHWGSRWEKAFENYDSVMIRYNDNLERIYKADMEKTKKERKFYNLTAFLLQFQDCIFCKKQMVDLLSRFSEVKNPESRAINFKRNHHIEYISKSDMKYAIREIARATKKFFEK